MPDASRSLLQSAGERTASSRDTLAAAEQRLARNRHVVDALTVRHQTRCGDVMDECFAEALRTQLILERCTAQLWISDQLLSIADTLITNSRQRVRESRHTARLAA